jgi:hypothetical protein
MPKLYEADRKPFVYNNIIYSPKYIDGEIICYEAKLKNLRVYVYPQKAILVNSIHKYWHGCNSNDFTLGEALEAIKEISNITGFNWMQATVKKLEYGCNIIDNASKVIRSLKSYKGKTYLPMAKVGVQYGANCEFEQYKVKGYDKTFEVLKQDKIRLSVPLFRWEIQVKNAKYFSRFKQPLPLTVSTLLTKQFYTLLANDATKIYTDTMKDLKIDLSKLKDLAQKRAIICFEDESMREELKRHHFNTYKKDRTFYNRKMKETANAKHDKTGILLKQKLCDLAV